MRHFTIELEELNQKLLQMGGLVESAIHRAVRALIEQDRELAEEVIRDEPKINRMEMEIDGLVTRLLALRQPVARDLRLLTAALKINNDLERMGDLATNIAKRSIFLAECERTDMIPDIRTMATQAQSMVKASLDALVNHDTRLARTVREDDDLVDNMRRQIQIRIKQSVRAEPEKFECWMKLNSVSRHIERLADMATNIAEEVIYMTEGEIVRHRPQE